MLVIFIIGQWAVVQFGTHLRAAPDISGTWDLSPSPPNEVTPGQKMIVRQSGRFADITFEGGPHFSAKLVEGASLDSSGGWTFDSKDWNLVFYAHDGSESRFFNLCGFKTFGFHGKRVNERR
jgi:hypothetical protein